MLNPKIIPFQILNPNENHKFMSKTLKSNYQYPFQILNPNQIQFLDPKPQNQYRHLIDLVLRFPNCIESSNSDQY